MPIHINLLAEAQAAEELRRRDPVKRAIFIGASLVVVSLMWSATVKVSAILARERFALVEGSINAQTNAYQRVESERKQIAQTQVKLAALQKLQSARFLQGNLLEALQHATVTGVQLTRLHVDQANIFKEGTAAQNNGDAATAGRPATVRGIIIVHLDARDYSANPGDQVNNFKQVIAKQPYFQAMLIKTNGVQLASPPSAPQNDAGKPYVMFTLDCRYPEVIR